MGPLAYTCDRGLIVVPWRSQVSPGLLSFAHGQWAAYGSG